MSGVFCFVNVKVTRRSAFESTTSRGRQETFRRKGARTSRGASIRCEGLGYFFLPTEEPSRRLGLHGRVCTRALSLCCTSLGKPIFGRRTRKVARWACDKAPSRCHQTRSAVQTVRARPIFTTRPYSCRRDRARVGILIQGNDL